jgi:hypothetical protein
MEPLYKNKEWLTQKYRVEELHVNEIAKLAGCVPCTAMNWIKKLGIETWESGDFAIYLTPEEIKKVALPNQRIETLKDWELPDLFVLYDDPDIIGPFVIKFGELWGYYFSRMVYISQIGKKVFIAEHWRKMTQMGCKEIRGPLIRIYDANILKDYKTYINSEEWAEKSKALRNLVGKCQLCARTENLIGHHNTYETLGKEGPYDITVLCSRCHAIFHKNCRVRKSYDARPILLTTRDGYDIMSPPNIPQDISKG